jgi:hypothetical protein
MLQLRRVKFCKGGHLITCVSIFLLFCVTSTPSFAQHKAKKIIASKSTIAPLGIVKNIPDSALLEIVPR